MGGNQRLNLPVVIGQMIIYALRNQKDNEGLNRFPVLDHGALFILKFSKFAAGSHPQNLSPQLFCTGAWSFWRSCGLLPQDFVILLMGSIDQHNFGWTPRLSYFLGFSTHAEP